MKKLFALLLFPCMVLGQTQIDDHLNKTPYQLLQIIDDQTSSDSAYWQANDGSPGDMLRDIFAFLDSMFVTNGQNTALKFSSQFSSLSAALTAAIADTSVLVINKRHYITADTTIAGVTGLVFVRDGRFNNATGAITTINVPFETLGGPYQIFEGNIDSVRIGKQTSSIYPEWFGAVGDGSNDDTLPLQAAFLSAGSGLAANNHEVILTRRYAITDSLGINSQNLRIRGLSSANYRLGNSGSYNSPLIDASSVGTSTNVFNIRGSGPTGSHTVVLENFRIDGHDTAGGTGSVIYAHSLRGLQLDRVLIYRSTLNGIWLDGSEGIVDQLYITNSSIWQHTGAFLYTGTGILTSGGVQSTIFENSQVSLFERNVDHVDDFSDPVSLGPWRWDKFYATNAGEEVVRLEGIGDIEFNKCSFESGSQNTASTPTFRMTRGTGFISDCYFSEETKADSGIVLLDSCYVVQIQNSTINNGSGNCDIRILGGDRISILNNSLISGGGAGIILNVDDDNDEPDKVRIIGNSINVTGIGIQTVVGTDSLTNCVVMGNTYGGTASALATEAHFDSSCLVINATGGPGTHDYGVPYFHNALTVGQYLAIGRTPAAYLDIEFEISDPTPNFMFTETGVTANNTKWDWFANGERMNFRLLNDAVSAAINWLTVDRTANTVDSLHFPQGGVKIGSVVSQGDGTLNAEAVYDNGVLLTDYVFEQAYRDTMRTIAEVEDFYEKNKHLPTINGRDAWEKNGRPSTGKLLNQLWETIEVQQIYISDLNRRLKELEAR